MCHIANLFKLHNIKTVIKANGLRYTNLNGKTFTSFRTDKTSHLVSFVSKLSPSPDWMVGVSMLEMCLTNCTWVAGTDLPLYPWDIGVCNGISYQTETTPSTPPQAIHRISSQHPLDMNNPFYHPQGRPVKPLARVTVTKIREYISPTTGHEQSILSSTGQASQASGQGHHHQD